MAKKLWSEIQIEKGIKLELTWFKPKTCWKKFKGKVHYLHHPNSQSGYEAALLEWAQKKAQLDNERPNAEIFQQHKRTFQIVKTYWEQFGLPRSEVTLAKQVDQMIDWIDECLIQPALPQPVEILAKCATLKALFAELHSVVPNLGTATFQLPEKWQERIDRLNNKEQVKRPQTIGYWIERFLARQDERSGKKITKDTAKSKHHKLSYYKRTADLGAHITSIDGDYIEEINTRIDELNLAKDTKDDYFGMFKIFLNWCHNEKDCEFKKPEEKFDSPDYAFNVIDGTGRKREEKKLLLWTPEEVKKAIDDLPAPYNCYVILMLNCGFRHQDISEMQHIDLRLNQKRIVIQRNKLKQQDKAPVIAYPLWDKTVELIRENISDHPKYVYTNERGGQVRGAIKTWWKRNKDNYGLGHKRLDFLRKTGSTFVARHNIDMDEFYLGETLKTIAKINYSFIDGEPLRDLDDAIMMMGSRFGLCEPPHKTITLTPDMLAKLESAGIEV